MLAAKTAFMNGHTAVAVLQAPLTPPRLGPWLGESLPEALILPRYHAVMVVVATFIALVALPFLGLVLGASYAFNVKNTLQVGADAACLAGLGSIKQGWPSFAQAEGLGLLVINTIGQDTPVVESWTQTDTTIAVVAALDHRLLFPWPNRDRVPIRAAASCRIDEESENVYRFRLTS